MKNNNRHDNISENLEKTKNSQEKRNWVSPQLEDWKTEYLGLKAGFPMADGSFKTYNL